MKNVIFKLNILSVHLPAEMFSSEVIWLIYSAHFNSKSIIVSIRTFHVFISFNQIKHSKLCLLKILAIKGVIKTWTTAVSTKRLILKSSKVIVPKNLTTSSEHFCGCMEYSVELFLPNKIKRQNKTKYWYFYFIDIKLNTCPQLWGFLTLFCQSKCTNITDFIRYPEKMQKIVPLYC